MPGLLPDVDPDGLLEFSVVYTDRALNTVDSTAGHLTAALDQVTPRS